MQKKSWLSLIYFLVFGLLIIFTFLFKSRSLLYVVIPIFFGFIVVLSLINVGGKMFSFSKGLMTMSKTGPVFTSKVWSWREGETIDFADIFPGLKDVTSFFSEMPLPKIKPERVAIGEKEGVNYNIYRLNFTNIVKVPASRKPGFRPLIIHGVKAPGMSGGLNSSVSQSFNILQARLTFPGSFPGRLIIQRVAGPTLGRDIDLESVEFNKKVQVYTNQAKIAYQILSPDFMDWYLKLPDQPVIAFDQQICYYTLIGFSNKGEEEITADIEQLIDRVLHSGALTLSQIPNPKSKTNPNI
ncbi:MAG: DUF3137 domain-containing protein [Patescibacteria group bacterium]